MSWTPDLVAADLREAGKPIYGSTAPVMTSRFLLNQAATVITSLQAEVARLAEDKDGAYLERNQLVAALTKLFPAGVAKTAIPGWSEDWHGCVYIELPTGQVSWHFHDSHAALFDHLPPYAGAWDGHDTPEKYRRLTALSLPLSVDEEPNK